ncbi:MAG: response regulator [Patescibacteria group bacterium]
MEEKNTEQNKKKVLVVDDDNNLRRVLVDKLSLSGFDTAGASNGKEGLEKALEWHPDAILLDILMPIMNGQQMLKELRADEWGKNVKVIMLTVIEDANSIAQAMEDGSLAYLIKTEQTMDEVVEKVKSMLK